MTREDYRTWAERQPGGRFERHQGIVVAIFCHAICRLFQFASRIRWL